MCGGGPSSYLAIWPLLCLSLVSKNNCVLSSQMPTIQFVLKKKPLSVQLAVGVRGTSPLPPML